MNLNVKVVQSFMQSLLIAVNAVVPFLIYISFGYLVKTVGIVDEIFLKRLNQMVFKAFYPIMMFYNMYNKERGLVLNPTLVLTAFLSLAILMVLLVVLVPRMVDDPGKQGVIIQAIYRSNFVLFAGPLMETVYGAKGMAVATMLIAFIVPTYNIIAVIVLEYYGNKNSASNRKTRPVILIKGILTNPLIAGILVGFVFYMLRIPLPFCVEKPVSQFAALTTPLALFVLGGTLKFGSIARNMRYLVPGIFVKLIVLPAMILVVCLALHLNPIERFLLFCMYGTPVAAASYAMAENMGCDGPMAGEFVVLSTSLSIITIFLWVFFLGMLGLV